MTADGRARRPQWAGLFALFVALLALVIVYRALRHPHHAAPQASASAAPPPAPRAPQPTAAMHPHVSATASVARIAPSASALPTPSRAGPKFFAAWGSGPDQLGHTRPQEGDPMGPMSLAVDSQGRVYILDEINGRIVRRGPDGQVEGTITLDQRTPEDIAIAKDGSVAVLDRLGDKDVALYDSSGAKRGTLPLVSAGIQNPGEVTSIIVNDNHVYAEVAHDHLVELGDTSGNPANAGSTLPGRPSRDGTAILTAKITDAATGHVNVTSMDRGSGRVRFSRDLALVPVVNQILLLDTDLSGTVYFAAEVQRPGAKAMVMMSCLDGTTGAVVGGALLPANTLPEESFRDFAVLDNGGVIYALRSNAGVTYQRYDCR